MVLLNDGILTDGQVPPRFHRWVNEDVTIFFQFDSPSVDEATALRNVGITVPGTFCAQSQPSEDFPHFHRTHAPSYSEGHGSAPGQVGYWLLWIATDTYEAFDGREVVPGVDRQFSPTPPPECEEATGGDAATPLALDVSGSEFHFSPSELHVPAGAEVTLTFTNDGSVPHTLTIPALDLDTGSVAAGESVTLSFTAPAEPGTHEVLCTFGGHAEEGMTRVLVVH